MPKQQQPEPLDVVRAFLKKADTYEDDIYLGIDPGTTGAIGLICNKLSAAIDIPVYRYDVIRTKVLSEEKQAETGRKTKRVHGTVGEFDYSAICDLFKLFKDCKDRLIVSLEKIPQRAGKGPIRTADIKIYAAWAMWPLFLTSKRYVFEEPRPNEWKQAMGLAGKDKEAARQKALKLFPSCEGIKRKKDHNRAEALLLALYVRNQREQPKPARRR